MKREGRQHGVVRTVTFLAGPLTQRPDSKSFNQLDSPPAAGNFAKVASKPTNHSKFTGKCGPKDKIKGTHKLRSGDVVLNHRFLSWRVVDLLAVNEDDYEEQI